MYIIFPSLVACVLCISGHGWHTQSPIEKSESPLQDRQKPGELSHLRALERLFLALQPMTAFNPSGFFTASNEVNTNRFSPAKMQLPWRKTRQEGIVKFFDLNKMFGFITMDNGEEIYVGQKGIDVSQKIKGIISLNDGEKVEFNIGQRRGGGIEAVDVTGPMASDLEGLKPGAFEAPVNEEKLPDKFQTVVEQNVQGTVVHWCHARAYGLIRLDTGDDVLTHIKNIHPRHLGLSELVIGERVQFNIATNAGDDRQAFDVTGVGGAELRGARYLSDEHTRMRSATRQRFTGIVKTWKPQQGWGFITPSEGEGEKDNVYCAIQSINYNQREEGVDSLTPGDMVEFGIEVDPRSRKSKRAFDVTGPGRANLRNEGAKDNVRGIVKKFDAKKGWGWITEDDGTEIAVHITGIDSQQLNMGIHTLTEGEEVEFSVRNQGIGRLGELSLRAVRVNGPDGALLKGSQQFQKLIGSNVVLKEKVRGIVKTWDPANDCGWITAEGGINCWAHNTGIEMGQQANGIQQLADGEDVEFSIVGTPDGNMKIDYITGPGGASLKGQEVEMAEGVVRKYDERAGWGLITKENGVSIYVSQYAISETQRGKGATFLVEGEKVEFRISKYNGQEKAVDVTGPRGADLKAIAAPQEVTSQGRLSGSVTGFFADKGWGFVVSDDTGEESLLHFSQIREFSKGMHIPTGQKVEYFTHRSRSTVKTTAIEVTGPAGVYLADAIDSSVGEGVTDTEMDIPDEIETTDELSTLWITDIPLHSTDQDVISAFDPYGEVAHAFLFPEKSGSVVMSGIVRYRTGMAAERALTLVQGQAIMVNNGIVNGNWDDRQPGRYTAGQDLSAEPRSEDEALVPGAEVVRLSDGARGKVMSNAKGWIRVQLENAIADETIACRKKDLQLVEQDGAAPSNVEEEKELAPVR